MSKYITFIDQVGRNILGKLSSAQEAGKLRVHNPVMIAVQPVNGQLQIQLVPLFFAEFVKYDETNRRNFEFVYDEKSIAIGNYFEIDEKIITQYERIVDGSFNAPQQPANAETKVVKLFSE